MIKLKNIGLKTASGSYILKNINAIIQPDDFIMLVGHNGAGKTTLFNILAGSTLASEGTIDTQTSMVSRVHQNPLQGTIASLSVEQNIALYLYKNKRVNLQQACSILNSKSQQLTMIKKYFPEDILTKKISSLSGGQRQLLTFLMATMLPLPLLLLDEPTAALDTQATYRMMQAIQQLHEQKKTALLMISHDPSIVHHYANKIWVLQNGSLINVIDQGKKSLLTLEQIRTLMHTKE